MTLMHAKIRDIDTRSKISSVSLVPYADCVLSGYGMHACTCACACVLIVSGLVLFNTHVLLQEYECATPIWVSSGQDDVAIGSKYA